jgi:hypothetical protein
MQLCNTSPSFRRKGTSYKSNLSIRTCVPTASLDLVRVRKEILNTHLRGIETHFIAERERERERESERERVRVREKDDDNNDCCKSSNNIVTTMFVTVPTETNVSTASTQQSISVFHQKIVIDDDDKEFGHRRHNHIQQQFQ